MSYASLDSFILHWYPIVPPQITTTFSKDTNLRIPNLFSNIFKDATGNCKVYIIHKQTFRNAEIKATKKCETLY